MSLKEQEIRSAGDFLRLKEAYEDAEIKPEYSSIELFQLGLKLTYNRAARPCSEDRSGKDVELEAPLLLSLEIKVAKRIWELFNAAAQKANAQTSSEDFLIEGSVVRGRAHRELALLLSRLRHEKPLPMTYPVSESAAIWNSLGIGIQHQTLEEKIRVTESLIQFHLSEACKEKDFLAEILDCRTLVIHFFTQPQNAEEKLSLWLETQTTESTALQKAQLAFYQSLAPFGERRPDLLRECRDALFALVQDYNSAPLETFLFKPEHQSIENAWKAQVPVLKHIQDAFNPRQEPAPFSIPARRWGGCSRLPTITGKIAGSLLVARRERSPEPELEDDSQKKPKTIDPAVFSPLSYK